MRRLLTVLALLVSATSACARTPSVDARDATSGCERGDAIGLSTLLTPSSYGGTYWTQIGREAQLTRGETRDDGAPSALQEVRVRDAKPVGRWPARAALTLEKAAVDEVVGELRREASVIVVNGDMGVAAAVAAVRRDSSVAFLGPCAAERFTPVFDRFVEARHAAGDRRPAGELFVALANDGSLLDALKETEYPSRPKPAWNDTPAERRVIDAEGVVTPPPDVMAGLTSVWVRYTFPSSWKSFAGTLAVYVPGVGWNGAVSFGLEGSVPSVVSYVPRSGEAEVWALDADARIGAPLARLGVLRASDVAGREEVRLVAQVEASGYDDLLRQARAGTVVFRVDRA